MTNQKQLRVLVRAPVETSSGYGVHSRQTLAALLGEKSFDVRIESIPWGNTPYLARDYPLKSATKEGIAKYNADKQHKQDNNYDVFVSVTIPQEFERRGTVNIGVTAATEVDRTSPLWVQKCQEMDLVIVPSQHASDVLTKTEIDWKDPQSGKTGTFKLTTPVVICNEGVDTSIFHKFTEDELTTREPNKIDSLKFDADFNFLQVAQWGKRKNIEKLIQYFVETFHGRQDVGLVLKLNMSRNTVVDHHNCLERLRQIKSQFKEGVPPIHLVHGDLTDEEMSSLYNHPQIKSFVTFTHGEGYGLPIAEAAACELPIIATNWSGQLDFLKRGEFSPVKFTMEEIPEDAVWENVMVEGSKWAVVNADDAKHRLKKMSSSYFKPQEWAKKLGTKIKEEFDVNVTNSFFLDTVKMALKNAATSAQINPLEHLQSFIDTPDDFNVIYTMPQSAGDIFMSTAVLSGLVKEIPKDAKIYFATLPQYEPILKDNPHVHKVIPWSEPMMNVELLEEVFDLALTPNIGTQLVTSNWVRKGQGRSLAEEFANHCLCELGDYHIHLEDCNEEGLDENYMTIHVGSGQGQWEARKYLDWQELVSNLKIVYPELSIVQVGQIDEPKLEEIDVDLRGKTSVHQLASVINDAELHVGIDSFSAHLAAGHDVPLVALYGSSHAKSTGPWVADREKSKMILLESEQKLGCNKACYKYQCKKNRNMPCINEISAEQILFSCATLLGKNFGTTVENIQNYDYKRIYGKISCYTTAFNCISLGIPFEQSIKSFLGVADELIILDGFSTDGTYERLEALAKQDDRIQVFQNEFDMTEPGIDGLQKNFARSLCEHEFLIQFDLDEVIHEDDYEKWKTITKRFPSDADILHLPVVELWGDQGEVTGRHHSWKWRMSRNKPEITHGIAKDARLTNEESGKLYAKKGMSDGCEYVNAMTFEPLRHVGFYNTQIEMARLHMPEHYGDGINEVFEVLPTVFHYSWFNLENKIKQLKKDGMWDKLWSLLYQEETQERFPDVDTDDQIKELAKHLLDQGGEDGDHVKYKFKLKRSQPAVMKDWGKKVEK